MHIIGGQNTTELPAYDFGILLEKWPRKSVQCIGEFHREQNANVDLSICIPMYNAQEYIGVLLQQIDGQITSYTYEVILVDDGLTDLTSKIVTEFCKDKLRFHYIYQKNEGISSARNTAIDRALGKYLSFIDSDDEICNDYIEIIMSKAILEDADILKGKYCLKRKNKIYQRGYATGIVWGGVYRTSLFDKIRFPVGYWYEDMINQFLVMPLSKKTVMIDDNLVYHNDVKDSASHIQSKAASFQALEQLYLVMSLAEEFEKLNIGNVLYLKESLVRECSSLMVHRTEFLGEEVQKQVFMACNRLFIRYNVSEEDFKGIKRMFVRAILSSDYKMWKMLANI